MNSDMQHKTAQRSGGQTRVAARPAAQQSSARRSPYQGGTASSARASSEPSGSGGSRQKQSAGRVSQKSYSIRPGSNGIWIVVLGVICIIALIVYRYLEAKLDNRFSISQIIPTLQMMDFMKYEGKGYQPVYTRTDLTDALHDAFGFCTSKQIVPVKTMRNICSRTKNGLM